MRISLILLASLTMAFFAIDLGSNSLSDIWESYFESENLDSVADNDGDGYSNFEEAIAGTHPLKADDHPNVTMVWPVMNESFPEVTFPSKPGKLYQLEYSDTMENFQPLGPTLPGTGSTISVKLSEDSISTQQAGIRHELWANLDNSELTSLTNLSTFPQQPDGRNQLANFDVPKVTATNFGGRLQALITPPQDGTYTFYLSSSSTADLHLSSNATEPALARIAQVLSSQTDITPNEWDRYSNQQSDPITLTAGTPYLVELHYLKTAPRDHVQVAWSGPGIADIQILKAEDLVPLPFLASSVTENTILLKNHDSSEQTTPLISTLVTSAPAGMTGNASYINAVVPTDPITLPGETTDHFYATWLFHMGASHRDLDLRFRNSSTGQQDGPRIDFEDSNSGQRAVVRPNNLSTPGREIEVTFDETYRIEIIASMVPGGFTYQAGLATLTAAEDTFDLYISDVQGRLVGSSLGVPFYDSGSDIVKRIDALRVSLSNEPNIYFDDWEITGGQISGNGYLSANIASYQPNTKDQFFRISITDQDQDQDGLTDWEELKLSAHQPVLFFDPQSQEGIADLTTITTLLNANQSISEFTLQASDTAAFESNSPNLSDDHGEITITRTGSLQAVTVQLCQTPLTNTGNTVTICNGSCCSLAGTAGDEEAEISDYILVDSEGNLITNSVSFRYAEMSKKLTLIATLDEINEYPETVNLVIEATDDNRYDISSTNGASIQLFDLPDHPSNEALFTGTFSQDANASNPSSGSGFLSAVLNGTRTQLTLTNEFSNLTSVQQDSHVHKAQPGPNSGDIIYAITEEPGNDETAPLNGPLNRYLWDLTESSGAIPTAGGAASKQTIIDSLFNQSNETPIYLNIHTVDNPAGEIWAFFNLSGGSQTEPTPPEADTLPGSLEYPTLSGDELESEVRRFLNQATFGATDSEVNELVSEIETARLTEPNYHRHHTYLNWLNTQMDPLQTPQSYLLDYNFASDFQQYTIAGTFDPLRNLTQEGVTAPSVPATWPTVDRTSSDPEHWHLTQVYPVSLEDIRLSSANSLRSPNHETRRNANWQMMLNAKDQLRHKMGFALQQIVVVSAQEDEIEDNPYGAANYVDQLNGHAFNYYRDVLGYVNWSPIMGKWLTSLQNQKAADLDGDGNNDIFPDENLARENMQLFSIGLFELWPDGSLRLGSDGIPIPTYSNEDIREYARIITGQSFSRYNSTSSPWGGTPYASLPENDDFDVSQNTDGRLTLRYSYPMRMFGEFHDIGVKSFAGTTIDNTHLLDPRAIGEADIEQALDWLAGKPNDGLDDYNMVNSHRSVPAFICRRLIQRFTTSNPSQDYLHRVATVFKNSEGDLGLTLQAILLDSEARVVDLDNRTFGMKKNPIECFIQIMRSLDGITHIPLRQPAPNEAPFADAAGDFTNPDLYLENFGLPATQMNLQERNIRFVPGTTFTFGATGLQVTPFEQPTVFNWYLPDYAPGGPISNAGLVAPELQIANEQDVIRNLNYYEDVARNNSGVRGDNLGDSTDNQRLVFNSDDSVDNNERSRLARAALADALYPDSSNAPASTDTRTSESLADEILLDNLDRRLTLGYLKRKYPYDHTDDDDPATPGVDDLLKNPRELIIDALTAHSDPFSGNNDSTDRINKLSDAIYLLTSTPEFQIKK